MRAQKQKTKKRDTWRVSLPSDLSQRAKLVAKAETRTLSNLLKRALEKYVEERAV